MMDRMSNSESTSSNCFTAIRTSRQPIYTWERQIFDALHIVYFDSMALRLMEVTPNARDTFPRRSAMWLHRQKDRLPLSWFCCCYIEANGEKLSASKGVVVIAATRTVQFYMLPPKSRQLSIGKGVLAVLLDPVYFVEINCTCARSFATLAWSHSEQSITRAFLSVPSKPLWVQASRPRRIFHGVYKEFMTHPPACSRKSTTIHGKCTGQKWQVGHPEWSSYEEVTKTFLNCKPQALFRPWFARYFFEKTEDRKQSPELIACKNVYTRKHRDMAAFHDAS